MAHASLLAQEISAWRGSIRESLVADVDIPTHAADALDDFAVVARLHAEDAAFGIAYMNMNDGRTRASGIDRGLRNLLRRHRAMRAFGELGVIAGDGTSDKDVAV